MNDVSVTAPADERATDPISTDENMTPLEKARAAMAAKREAGEKLVYRDPIEKAIADPTSKTKALKAKCWECVGAGDDPGAKQTIGECTSFDCPLWPHRPYQHLAPEGYGLEQRAESEKRYLARRRDHQASRGG